MMPYRNPHTACRLPQTVAENGNLDDDVSPSPPAPSASSVSSDAVGVTADQFVPGLSHSRDGQRRQNLVRGHRRGGRSRPQHRRAAPITEHLDKLSLSSDCAEEPIKAKAQGKHGHQVQVNSEFCQSKTGGVVSTERRGTLASPGEQPACQAALETECPEDAADYAGSGGHRERRRGPHRHTPRPAHYHWDARASRNRGGAGNPYNRGGGPRRGHGRGFQQLDRERGREEVL